MLYSILKDKSCDETIEYIKSILNNLDIPVCESVLERKVKKKIMPFSMRLTLFDSNIGVNGKGSELKNCMASAYAELMERLQNQALFSFVFEKNIVSPDEKNMHINAIRKTKFVDSFDDFGVVKKLNYISNFLKKFSLIGNISKRRLHSENNVTLVPFYDLNERKIVNLPIKIINIIQGTNGMAAGNTYEEAIVQGLSEICERYSLSKILTEHISMPFIPEDEYLKYQKIKDLLDYIKSNGYNIHIKDASIGKKIPVVCIIIEDIEKNLFYFKLGAHPFLPIAIERTLTEFYQGIDFSDKTIEPITACASFYSEKKLKYSLQDVNSLFAALTVATSVFSDCETFRELFLNKNFSYEYTGDAWINSEIHLTNKKMLSSLIDKISILANKEIYIRDVSFLGFPSVYIYIPNMSVLYRHDKNTIMKEINMLYWLNYSQKLSLFDFCKPIESLLDALEYRIDRDVFFIENQISSLPNEYLALLCSIVMNDTFRIRKYTELLIDNIKKKNIMSEKKIFLFEMINEYYSIDYKTFSEKEKINNLKTKYTSVQIEEFEIFINSISYRNIKTTIKRNKYVVQEMKNGKIMDKLYAFRLKMGNLYEKNVPTQYNIKKTIESSLMCPK